MYKLYLINNKFEVYENRQETGIYICSHERWEYLYDKAQELNNALNLKGELITL